MDRSGATRKWAHLRWYICGLLFYATTVNYMDRMVLGILKPTIAAQLHWTDTQYGLINSAFQLGYAIMLPISGRLIDWLGIRLGYTAAVVFWSLSSMAHSLAGSAFQFGVARLGLGLGEAANFPAALKTVADWFPRRERATAVGLFNSGSNIGAVVAPLVVPILTARFGWHSAFLFTGSLSATWAIVWFFFYREPEQHRRLSAEELRLIRSDQDAAAPTQKFSYLRLLSTRAAWAFVIGKFLTDPVWWFYLFWLPGFLNAKYGLDLIHLGPPLATVYLSADIGSIGGGWLSSSLLKRGWTPEAARKTAMLVCALAVTAVIFVPYAAAHLWFTVALVSIAASAHQGWSANIYTMASDCFPRRAMASIVGLGGFGGALGGMLAQPAIGRWLDFSNKAYGPIFLVAGSMYLITLAIIHLILPRFEQQAV
ncbi:MAG: MFS transporter [Acidobacteriaceae bacterium]|nr:MFS transporter [Acidobacteriaceae bacterium]